MAIASSMWLVVSACRTEGAAARASSGAVRGANATSGEAAAGGVASAGTKAFDEAYREGVSRMENYLILPRDNVREDKQARADLTAAVQLLDRAIALKPESSTAWWSRGKAEQLLGDHEAAYDSFHRSFKIDQGNNPDSGVQLVLECLETGRGGEAVEVAQSILQSQPDNAGMLSNLALAQLINGQVDDAARTINRAAMLDPDDLATTTTKRRIDDVRAGRRPLPHHISDIIGGK